MSHVDDEVPVDALARWTQHGAIWRVSSWTAADVVVDLCTCAGEPVDQLRVTDPEGIRYLATHRRSDEE